MAAENFHLWTKESKLQPADLPVSSLASLHLRDEAVVINENTNHMGDNPEPHRAYPVMSSLLTQHRQQTEISMACRPELPPADQGKLKVLY